MLQVLLTSATTLQDGGDVWAPTSDATGRAAATFSCFCGRATDRKVVCLGVTDTNADGERVGAMFEATPDFPSQLQAFQSAQDIPLDRLSVFLTHAHIGHYSGLMFLGREARLGAKNVDVWAIAQSTGVSGNPTHRNATSRLPQQQTVRGASWWSWGTSG